MTQIYDFERHDPPALNERTLLRRLEQRRLRIETALLALAGLLLQGVVVLFGYSAMDWYPMVSAFCFGYVVISTTGFGVCAIAYARKGGKTA